MRTLTVSVTIVLAVILFVSACSKIDTTNIGGDLIPAVDNINTFETILDVITDNKLFNDTTRMLYNSEHALGIIENDAEFGKTTASIYSSFTPSLYRSYPFGRKDSVTLDSVVLSMSYVRVLGDTTAVQHIEIKEITPTTTFTDSLYRLSSDDFPTDPSLLGEADVNFDKLNDSIFYRDGKDVVRSKNEMRIKLDTSWARRFVNYDTASGQPFNNDSTFKTVFKGLEIKATDGSANKKALAYFNLDDNTKTRLIFYYRKPNNGKTDTAIAAFVYTSDPHANIIRRTPANNYLANVNNGTDNDALLYIQSAPGSYATVKIPGIDTLQNRVIHRAELICEKAPSLEDFYAVPNTMFIDAINSANDSSFTIRNDFVPTTSGGDYERGLLGGTISKNKYIFTLTRYFQSIVTKGFPNPTLRIHAPFTSTPFYTVPNSVNFANRLYLVVNEPVSFGRVILYGGAETDPSKKMRLRIIYSKI